MLRLLHQPETVGGESTRVHVWPNWSEAYSNESSASTHESVGMRP